MDVSTGPSSCMSTRSVVASTDPTPFIDVIISNLFCKLAEEETIDVISNSTTPTCSFKNDKQVSMA